MNKSVVMETDQVTLPARDSFTWFCDYRKSEAFRSKKLVKLTDSGTGLSEEANLRLDSEGKLKSDSSKTSIICENNSLSSFPNCYPLIGAQTTPLVQTAVGTVSDNTNDTPLVETAGATVSDNTSDMPLAQTIGTTHFDNTSDMPLTQTTGTTHFDNNSDMPLAQTTGTTHFDNTSDKPLAQTTGTTHFDNTSDKPLVQTTGTTHFDSTRESPNSDEINDTCEPPKNKDEEDKAVTDDERASSPDGLVNSLNPMKSDREIGSNRLTWRDHLTVRDDTGNLRKGRHKDFNQMIVRNDTENLRKGRHKDFKRCSRKQLIADRKRELIERRCNELVRNLKELTTVSSALQLAPERKIVERNSRSKLRSSENKTESAGQKKLVRTPRAISLERATLRRKTRIPDGYHTPPHNHPILSQQTLYWDVQDGRCCSNQIYIDLVYSALVFGPLLGPEKVRYNMTSSSRLGGSETVLSNLTQKTTEGIPVTQPKSYSVTTSPNFNPSKTLTRQRSSSGSLGGKKTPPWRIDDKTLKRTRLNSNQYELSQDLQDKQVEMLERKYGGVCARKAALTIQRAFRKYCMNRRFQELADYVKRERQVSRRFTTTDSEVKVWPYSDDRKCRSCTSQDDTFYGADNDVRVQRSFTYTDAINRSTLLREFSEECHRLSSPTHQLGPTERRVCLHNHQMDFRYHPKSFPERGSLCGDVLNRVSCDDFVFVPATPDDNSLYYTPPMGVRPSPAIPRHPAWTAIPRSGGKTFTHLNSGPDLLLSPSQSTPSGGVLERYYTPTQSLSSEDSAISSGAGEPCVDFLQDGQRQLYPASLTRQILTVPSEYTPQWQTPVRSANRKITPPHVEQEIALTQGFRRISSLPVQEIRTFNKSPIRSSQVSSTNYNSRESSLDYNQSPAMNNNSEVSERTKQSIKKVYTEASPIWKRKALVVAEQTSAGEQLDDKRLSNISETSEDSLESASYSTVPPVSSSESFVGQNYSDCCRAQDITTTTSQHKTQVSDLQRKRQYRVGLNLFNKKPEKGISYLIQSNFLEPTAKSVARFLISRKGLSKQNIGEYLGNLQNGFNSAVLESFVEEIDLAGMQVDVALRKYQTFFRMPGEAQKIERLIEVFSRRYSDCNRDIVSKFQNPDTVFVLAFAIIMLNTDLHTPNMKADKRMKLEDFIKNLRAIDDGHDLDRDMLSGIYERIKVSEFKTGSDHMTQVMKVQQTIVGKKPNLAQPHRRLVCYCRLYEVYDINKKERAGIHQREVFLFNDMLMVSKIFSKKKTSITYTFRQSFPLCGINVTLFEAPHYPHGIRLTQRVDNKVLITFNARNEHDRTKFVDDLKESILEMDEMENLRIETELEKQKSLRNRVPENRDSGVQDIEIFPTSSQDNNRLSPDGQGLNMKHSALSNSLLDLHDPQMNKPVRRGSAGSLDSGMSVSFQSSAASTGSQDSSSQMVSYSGTNDVRNISESVVPPGTLGGKSTNQQSFLGGLFGKKTKSSSKGSVVKTTESTDV